MSVSLNHICSYQGGSVPLKIWNFPGGESGVQIPQLPLPSRIKVEDSFFLTWEYAGDHEMMVVAQVVDVLRRSEFKNSELILSLPYLPYARQDRVCSEGESHALKVFATWLNSLKFDSVIIMDPHSYVAEAVVDNMVSVPQEVGYAKFLSTRKEGYDILLAPDAGAAKKVENCRLAHQRIFGVLPEIVVAHKVRKGDEVSVNFGSTSLQGKKVCVIDDICDGGRTFISLGEHVRSTCEPETFDLYVTHGIFSNIDQLIILAGSERQSISGLFDKIFTANLMNKKVSNYVTTI
ncbi:putative phosphoribosylpyrophosphate synthetase [Aeromonas phage phiA8-29]|uniref:Putative phosphoribosylpyrophosphate synthetase n=1 Tax=Aeromonas phage phiA8-29 TaxID=1978922 RepID=A0A1W6DYC7_9CAUD|nr:ribose-phosphate pyrophosphokinase [Aeromonas phage phiA8-29]ARK07908.1 putative phosphoribosylpyrophosphate synthetase [Aeromonas phage phiA8-29]